MKAIIITEDSLYQLPAINKWKKTLGQGEKIENNSELVSLLRHKKYPIPTNNVEHEARYKEIFADFVRPADKMFAGLFLGVRTFRDRLDTLIPTDLLIISGRYGLISANTPIIPYSYSIKSGDDLRSLDATTKLSEKIIALSNNADLLIFSLQSIYLRYFISNGLFLKLNPRVPVIIVGAKQIGEELPYLSTILFLPRKGVARLEKENQGRIIDFVEKLR